MYFLYLAIVKIKKMKNLNSMYLYSFLFVFLLTLGACKNDLEINADPKETAVVYGILDPSADYQYLRINKTFLVQSNALQAAKDGSLMSYNSNLKVTLYSIEGNNKIMHVFTADSSFIKNSGLFYTQPHVVFKATTTPTRLLVGSTTTYKLEIENLSTGYKCYATTKSVTPSEINKPISFSTFYGPFAYTLNLFNPNSGKYSTLEFEFTSGKNVKVVFPYLRMYYHERRNNQNSGPLFIDFPFASQRIEKASVQSTFKITFNTEDFYRYIGDRLTANGSKRFVDSMSFMLDSGNEDFDTFYAVSNTSTNTTLEKPTFSNITNGIGILAAKYTSFTKHKNYYNYPSDLRPFYLDPSTNSISAGGLTASSLKELATGKYTKHLGFAYFITTQANPIDTLFAP
jgi:hypothetical protein